MNLVQRVDTVTDDTHKIFEKYNDVFNGLGSVGCITNIQYSINIEQSYRPVVHPPPHVPVKLHFKVQEELKCVEQLNVIEKMKILLTGLAVW